MSIAFADILFGSQMRDYDGRFQKLEERLAREAGNCGRDLQRQLQALETFMKGEAESMSNRVKAEQAERGQAFEQLAREMAETARGLELKISNLDSQAAQDIRDLREQLLEQSKALSDELKERHEQVKGISNASRPNSRRHDWSRSARRDAERGGAAVEETNSAFPARPKRCDRGCVPGVARRPPPDDLSELRRLHREAGTGRQLRELHERLDDKEQRAHDDGQRPAGSGQAFSADRSEELTRALRPAVEGSIRESIEKRPQVFHRRAPSDHRPGR